ncbi:MAG TPA: hypothetical protein VK932_16260 [Kofleriaceae bacterium]|nr:hypothetical protein [Kofleriaceae bacterium]
MTTQLAQKVPKPGLFVPLPGAVSELLLRCLERDESARYPDVTARAAAIDEVLGQSDMELLATRTSTTRGHAPARKVATGPVAHLGTVPNTPPVGVPQIPNTPPVGFEAPPARRLVEDPAAGYPAVPAPMAPLAHSGGVPAPHLVREHSGPAPAGPPPRTSALRIVLLMLVLAAIGVGAGVMISELGG